MNLRPYPEYKDSGIGLTGSLPSHWSANRVKNVSSCLDHLRVPKNSGERADMKGDIPYWGANSIQGHVDRALVHGPVVLVGEDGAPFFDSTKPVAFFIDGPLWPNNHVHVLRTMDSTSSRFLTACLNSVDYSLYIKGSTRDKLNQVDLMSILIPSPPPSEQRVIADFLDHETAEIDAFIADQNELIGFLIERRAATIDTITWSGLDAEVPYGEVALEPIPDAPHHWQRVRNKNIFEERRGLSVDGEEELLTVSHITGVTPRSEKQVNMIEALSHEDYKLVECGDLAINTMWAWMGAMGVSDYRGIVSPAYGVYRPIRGDYHGRYFDYLYRSRQYVCAITRFSRGLWSSRLRLYPDVFLAMPVIVPPLEEQEQIADYLDHETAEIDAAIADAKEAIRLSKERRAALISAAVTGKIDVRDHAPAEGEA